jgi:hypothetical protein
MHCIISMSFFLHTFNFFACSCLLIRYALDIWVSLWEKIKNGFLFIYFLSSLQVNLLGVQSHLHEKIQLIPMSSAWQVTKSDGVKGGQFVTASRSVTGSPIYKLLSERPTGRSIVPRNFRAVFFLDFFHEIFRRFQKHGNWKMKIL